MQIASGIIVGGKVVVEGLSLPEGTVVTVLAQGDEVAVKLAPKQEADLMDALDEADREEGISAEELFARLRRFG
jgi:dihydroxyacetone kinase-like predicted kinase